MKQDLSGLTLEQGPHQTIGHSEMANIRFMFHEINGLYLDHKPSDVYFFTKRVLDVVVSVFFIVVVMSWLMPLLAILIKLTSKGPAIFVQKRTGQFGREFNCFKFRTMYVNDEADTRQVSINDTRITKIGKFLRVTHLDETPQFFNVLSGEMSIVGPRPHMLYHTRHYAACIPYYNLRHEVKPGITGMAQIKDYIGEINGERELRKRIQWDIYYMKHQNTFLDVKILVTTFLQIFKKGGSWLSSMR